MFQLILVPQVMASVAAALRLTDPAILHYRSVAFESPSIYVTLSRPGGCRDTAFQLMRSSLAGSSVYVPFAAYAAVACVATAAFALAVACRSGLSAGSGLNSCNS